jgi:hypothetical protein
MMIVFKNYLFKIKLIIKALIKLEQFKIINKLNKLNLQVFIILLK